MPSQQVVFPDEVCQSLPPLDQWDSATKKPNPVQMVRVDQDFEVETAEGRMKGKSGDYLVHDPLSGHYWPISAKYRDMHYDSA